MNSTINNDELLSEQSGSPENCQRAHQQYVHGRRFGARSNCSEFPNSSD